MFTRSPNSCSRSAGQNLQNIIFECSELNLHFTLFSIAAGKGGGRLKQKGGACYKVGSGAAYVRSFISTRSLDRGSEFIFL